jgi:hypothetical protein
MILGIMIFTVELPFNVTLVTSECDKCVTLLLFILKKKNNTLSCGVVEFIIGFDVYIIFLTLSQFNMKNKIKID